MDRPKKIIQVLRQFEEVFSEGVWEWARVLVIGAILAKGRTNGDSDCARNGRPREAWERVSLPWLRDSLIRPRSGRGRPSPGMVELNTPFFWRAKLRPGITTDCHQWRSVGDSF